MVDVVTSENRAEFMQARMDLNVATAPEAPMDDAKVEPEAAAKPAPKVEAKAQPEAETAPELESDDLPPIRKRFSDLTSQRDAAKAEAEAAKARADAAEARARELETKLNPPKLDEIEAQIGARPKAADYTDVEQFAEDLAEWGGKRGVFLDARARASQDAQAERAKQVTAFNQRQAEFKASHPDYDQVIGSASAIPVAPDILEELLTSDVGLAVQYHLGQNHDEITRLNKLTPAKRMLEFGRLEERIRLAQAPKAKETKEEPEPVRASTPARPKLPEPVRPITPAGGSATVSHLFDADGEFTGTTTQWKQLRAAGKIK